MQWHGRGRRRRGLDHAVIGRVRSLCLGAAAWLRLALGTRVRIVRKGKGGMAVVRIRKRACSGCFKQIPPQRIQEIRRGDRIFSCDSCGRILTWTEEESN